jgi:hypothetical protein
MNANNFYPPITDKELFDMFVLVLKIIFMCAWINLL